MPAAFVWLPHDLSSYLRSGPVASCYPARQRMQLHRAGAPLVPGSGWSLLTMPWPGSLTKRDHLPEIPQSTFAQKNLSFCLLFRKDSVIL